MGRFEYLKKDIKTKTKIPSFEGCIYKMFYFGDHFLTKGLFKLKDKPKAPCKYNSNCNEGTCHQKQWMALLFVAI